MYSRPGARRELLFLCIKKHHCILFKFNEAATDHHRLPQGFYLGIRGLSGYTLY